MKKHFIFDFETFGQNAVTCPIINCAYFIFDWDRFLTNPYTLNELISRIHRSKLNVSKQCDAGYILEKSSLEFWKSLPKEVLQQIKPAVDDLSMQGFYDELLAYIDGHKIEYWWSRSNTFDPVILMTRVKDLDPNYEVELLKTLKFWRVRDIRTYIDAKFDFQLTHNSFIPLIDEQYWKNTFKEHDSIYDVAADILRLQCIARSENGLERV